VMLAVNVHVHLSILKRSLAHDMWPKKWMHCFIMYSAANTTRLYSYVWSGQNLNSGRPGEASNPQNCKHNTVPRAAPWRLGGFGPMFTPPPLAAPGPGPRRFTVWAFDIYHNCLSGGCVGALLRCGG
jgi:hypothetical protein